MSFVVVLDAAIAGTQRQAPSPSPALGGDEIAKPAERRLLRAAAFEGLRRLPGRPLERRDTFADAPLCPPETLEEVPHAAAARLSDLLDEYRDLLPEWLRIVARRRLRVPHALLPELLDYASETVEDRPVVQAVGGERLQWLASRNAAWSFAAGADPEERFLNGSREERIAAFSTLRESEPAHARELLAANGASERADTRGALIALLVRHLSVDDEGLLEEALRSARKEVRGSALHLLRQLPESSFALRWTRRAQTIVDFRRQSVLGFRRDNLSIQPPTAAEPEWMVDGLDPAAPKGIGPTAWILQQVVAFTPPTVWPLDALDTFVKSDWSRPLLAGLGQAAATYRTAEWCEVLLMTWATALEKRDQLPLDGRSLFGALDNTRAEAMYRSLLRVGIAGPAALAGVRRDPWSVEFSMFMLNHIPQALARWQYAAAAVLRDAPLRLDPAVLPQAERVLDELRDHAWAYPSMSHLVATLALRADMRRELDAPPRADSSIVSRAQERDPSSAGVIFPLDAPSALHE